jgi:dihydroorotate dehydrogenase electron transfer subunit
MNKILSNRQLTGDIYEMILSGNTDEIERPGQFINIKISGLYLRRPISICDWNAEQIKIVYRVIGQGTEALSRAAAGESLDILYPLGNGYIIKEELSPTVAGGGIGIPPLYALTKALCQKGLKPRVALGFNSKEEAFYEEVFRELGADVRVATVDGSYGVKGFVTDIIDDWRYVYACGPEAMLSALWERAEDGQFSFEARMGCGFGGCMGCSCKTKYGYKRICKEGPVLEKEEILW